MQTKHTVHKMEWADLLYSPLEQAFYGLLSPQFEIEQPKLPDWTEEENKLFETALAAVDPNSPSFFEDVVTRVPWRSVEEIKIHYQALVEDLDMIESGRVPVPDCLTNDAQPERQLVEVERHSEVVEAVREDGSSSNDAKPSKKGQPRRRGIPWTEEEHRLFLMGLNRYGKGDWRSISRYYVTSKTPTQVASHAQKYYRRQTSSTPKEKRRPSIHDIQTVSSPSYTAFPPWRGVPITTISGVGQAAAAPFPSHGLTVGPTLNHGYNGAGVVQDPIFVPPMGATFPAVDYPMLNQGASGAAYPAPAYSFPAMSNQPWG